MHGTYHKLLHRVPQFTFQGIMGIWKLLLQRAFLMTNMDEENTVHKNTQTFRQSKSVGASVGLDLLVQKPQWLNTMNTKSDARLNTSVSDDGRREIRPTLNYSLNYAHGLAALLPTVSAPTRLHSQETWPFFSLLCWSVYPWKDSYCLLPLLSCLDAAAHLLTGTSKFEHTSPMLASVTGCLYILESIKKIILFEYKVLNGLAPPYLTELLPPYRPCRSLGSHHVGCGFYLWACFYLVRAVYLITFYLLICILYFNFY